MSRPKTKTVRRGIIFSTVSWVEAEVPVDATEDQIEEAIWDNGPGGLCYHCSCNFDDPQPTGDLVSDE